MAIPYESSGGLPESALYDIGYLLHLLHCTRIPTCSIGSLCVLYELSMSLSSYTLFLLSIFG